MPETALLPDPHVGFRIRLDIGDKAAGWFAEVGGLSVERGVKEHAEGGVNDHVHWLPGVVSRSSLTLRCGVVTGPLWTWFKKGLYDGKVERRQVSVIFLDAQGKVIRQWDIPDAFPARWTGPDLKSASSEVAVESIELATGGGGEGGGQGGEAPEEGEPEVNVPRLAVKVYDLLRRELRVERDRLGRRDFW